jgi:uncharacterized protein (DUF1800 family)
LAFTETTQVEINMLLEHDVIDDVEAQLDEGLDLSRSALTALASAALVACGGGGGGAANPSPTPVSDPVPTPVTITREQASRFLGQAAFGADAASIDLVKSVGYTAWLDQQFALPRGTPRLDYLYAKGFNAVENKNTRNGVTNALWHHLLANPDVLRQRMTLALSEIVVVGVLGIANLSFKAFSAMVFMDILEANAFGNYRTLLDQVSTSTAMGSFLTYRGNTKANLSTGSMPDENYARELMQLFTIGLLELNIDGTPRLVNGKVAETYVQDDVSQMARVFTGWDLDASKPAGDSPERVQSPMVQTATKHEPGEKRFLTTVIPAGTDGVQSLKIALDALMAHANIGPFISRQLIQRLVTSNPSAAYVARVATAFNNNGANGVGGVKGDLKATLKAILLDDEARSATTLADPAFGKLREPIVRFVQWARLAKVGASDDLWRIGDTSDPATRLGQSPMISPSVFNFFRPGYVPSSSALGGRTVPELQITNETSVAGYVNYMQQVISGTGNLGTSSGITRDYTALLALITPLGDSAALLAELNVLLAAGQLSAATLAPLKSALDTVAVTTPAGQLNRLYAALTLVMAAPEYITQK